MYEIRAKSSTETDVLMYGSISEWGRVRAEDFIRSIANAKAKGYSKINLKINSPGGSIIEGIAIMSQMLSKDVQFVGIVEGLAASMGSVILQGCQERVMVKGTRIMVHQGEGETQGSANFIRDYADLLDSFNRTLAEIYAKRTKKEVKWIQENWMAEGKNTWFTSEEALKAGLIDRIIEGNVKPLEKETATLTEMAAHYEQFCKTNNDEMKKDEIIKLLGMKAESTDQEVLDAVAEAARKANEAAKTKPDAVNKIMENFVALAKERGVTEEKQLNALKKLAESDLAAAMDLLPAKTEKAESENEPVNLKAVLTALRSENGGAKKDDRSSWKFSDWETKDPAGFAALLKEKPKEYARLFKETFGIEPTEAELRRQV